MLTHLLVRRNGKQALRHPSYRISPPPNKVEIRNFPLRLSTENQPKCKSICSGAFLFTCLLIILLLFPQDSLPVLWLWVPDFVVAFIYGGD